MGPRSLRSVPSFLVSPVKIEDSPENLWNDSSLLPLLNTQAGALPVLIIMLKNGNQWGKEAAARTLRNISFFENLRTAVIESGAIDALNQTTATGSARAAESARAALNNLTGRRLASVFRNRATQQESSTTFPVADVTPLSTASSVGPANADMVSGETDPTAVPSATAQVRIAAARFLRGTQMRVHPERGAVSPSVANAPRGYAPRPGTSSNPSSPPTTRVLRSAAQRLGPSARSSNSSRE